MKTGILIGYFVKNREAREAFKKLRGHGFRRVAWVSRNAEEEIHTGDPFLWYRFFGAAAAFFLFAGFAAVSSITFRLWGPEFSRWPSALIPAVAGGIVGALLSTVWI
ncbi:MAG: hypothetical protein KJ645_09790, partial [Planctomycetes bacterium]|nr:hypothetical protein [Planctomycetota bacterium]